MGEAFDYGPASDRIMPIPIRAGVSVLIQDLPHDLTAAEAAKIVRVIRSLASPTPNPRS